MPFLTRAAARLVRARDPRRLRFGGVLGTASVLVAIGTVASSLPPTAAASEKALTVAQEYDLKAAFLFNFAQFVDWPTGAFTAVDSPITIGVLGKDPFGGSLDEIVAGETIRERPLVIRRYVSVEQVDACHILFISASEMRSLDHILKAIGRRSILTVGEGRDFTTRSGMIGFIVSHQRLRLRINLTAVGEARLTISSKLLRQAEVVGSGGTRN